MCLQEVVRSRNSSKEGVVSVHYLGHRISKEGMKPTEKKVSAITHARRPSNVFELRSFLGLINFYSKFLPNLSSVLSPLSVT